MYQRKPGDGSLFTNGYKQKETHPDWKGDFLGLDGVEYEIAGWTKSTRDGKPWYSLKVSPKRAKADDRRPERGSHPDPYAGFKNKPAETASNNLDEDLPF